MNDMIGDSLSRVRERRPDVYALAMLASLSPRITPDYLRELRLELGTDAYRWALRKNKSEAAKAQNHAPDADSEAALWFNPLLVRGRGPEGIALHPEISQRLQVELKDSKLLARAAGTLEEHSKSLPPELKWQAELSMRLLEGNDRAVERLEEKLLAALRDSEQQQLARTVAHWLLRDVHPALPDLRRIPLALVSEIVAGTLTSLQQPLFEVATGMDLDGLQQYDVTDWVRMEKVGLRRVGGYLEIAVDLAQPTHMLEIPVTNPFVIRVRTKQGEGREKVLRFVRGGPRDFAEVGIGAVDSAMYWGECSGWTSDRSPRRRGGVQKANCTR